MIRSALASLGLMLATPAIAAEPAAAGEAPAGEAPATGTPTNATATVSPTSVADAASRGDPSLSNLNLSLGTTYAGGDFGAAKNTTLWSTAAGARLTLGNLRLTASIPYMRIRSNGSIVSGIDSTPVVLRGDTLPRKVTTDGFGDLTLGGSYTIPDKATGLEVELSGRVKLPTATRASNLSTQQTDYSAGVQVTRTMGEIAPFASVTYRIFGDPNGIDLRDGLAASVGSSVVLDRRTAALFSYHYARAATRFVRDAHELFAGASTLLPGDRFRLTGFATAGLSKGAAAASGGLSLSLDL